MNAGSGDSVPRLEGFTCYGHRNEIIPLTLERPAQRQTPRRDRGGLNDGRRGLAVCEKAVQHAIEMGNLLQINFHDEAVFSSDAVTLRDFGYGLRKFSYLVQMPRQRAHSDESHHLITELFRV